MKRMSPTRTVRPVGILGGVRIPFCRNNTAYADVGNLGMSIRTLGALVERFGLHGAQLGEVALGAVLKHSSDWNLGREATLSSGLSPATPGITLQRACGTSLDTVIHIANKIALGQIDSGIGGGSDTTSDVPINVSRPLRRRLLDANMARSAGDRLRAFRGFSPRELKPEFPGVGEPRTGKSMGQHCELMAQEWKIGRADQDALAAASHHKAAAAYERGFFEGLVVPFRGMTRDNILRPDTTVEKLATLKPAFDKISGRGTLTAGNSTPLTDGASAVLLGTQEWAESRGLKVQAWLVDAQVAAVDFVHGEGLLMAPLARMGKREFLPRQAGPRRAAGQHRSGQAQRGRQLAGVRASLRGDRRTHHRHPGQAAGRARQRPRPGLGLHRRRHGRHRHTRTLKPPISQTQSPPFGGLCHCGA